MFGDNVVIACTASKGPLCNTVKQAKVRVKIPWFSAAAVIVAIPFV